MKALLTMIALFGWSVAGYSQSPAALPLWPDKAPGALGTEDKDKPTLTPYLPEPANASGAAMVICPGGGYGGLASHEGPDYARFLNEYGIAAFVLKYRLGSAGYRHPIMLQDVARAVRMVRARAAEWKVDPKRIGLMGSSAGGHLASTLLTHFDAGRADSADLIERQSSRPDLGILCYPVITMGQFTHQGSKHNLLGNDPSADLVQELSNELHVSKRTPPCFVWSTWEDKVVPVENSFMFAEALQKQAVPFDFHVYQKGPHGIGLGAPYSEKAKRHPWTADLVFWLQTQGFVKAAN
jgi:acetyl esterase/lipase